MDQTPLSRLYTLLLLFGMSVNSVAHFVTVAWELEERSLCFLLTVFTQMQDEVFLLSVPFKYVRMS
jgi:hypothetical protein